MTNDFKDQKEVETRRSALNCHACVQVMPADLLRKCEVEIRKEIVAYFPEMTVCRYLKAHGSLAPQRSFEQFPSEASGMTSGAKRSRSQRMLEELCEALPSATAKRLLKNRSPQGSATPPLSPYVVECSSAATRAVDALSCSVLADQFALLAETVVCVKVQKNDGSLALHPVAESSRSTRKTRKTSQVKTESVEEVSHCSFSLSLYSTHLVDRIVPGSGMELRPSSFSMQSVLLPGQPFQLECYTHHMFHFGLLCYAMWNAHDAVLEKLLTSTRNRAVSSASLKNATIAHKSAASSNLIPCRAEDSVLILGLGGNALGSCLDTFLPRDVVLDVVEIEPAMVNICLRNGLVPPLSSPLGILPHHSKTKESSSTGRKVSYRGSGRGSSTHTEAPSSARTMLCRRDAVQQLEESSQRDIQTQAHRSHYSFYVMDAFDFLKGDFIEPVHSREPLTSSFQEGKRKPSMAPPPTFKPPSRKYNLIFLDCYDPLAGTMMHSSALLSLCSQRLAPGGALLVNAHMDADSETLKNNFLYEGFASVQVLKVSGCRQCVVVCLKANQIGTVFHSPTDRFSLPLLRKLTAVLNDEVRVACPAVSSITFDARWLQKSSGITAAFNPEGASPCRVWEHNA